MQVKHNFLAPKPILNYIEPLMKELNHLRTEIDSIDNQILKLLSERGKAAKAIGKIKKENGASIHSPAREQSIYDRLSRQNHGPYKDETVLSIFREIISATRALEAPLRVSYLGPEATFTHISAVNHFGSSATLIPESGIQNVFAEVEKGHSDFGVVPIENSTEGVVSHTLDLFLDSPLKICAEEILRVGHHLLSREDNLKKIKKIYSHPQAIAQCRNWLFTHLPNVAIRELESTSLAAKKASQEKGAGAIASELAASHYGIKILQKEIQDQAQNYTRFMIIGNHQPEPTGNDKTSVLFIAKDQVGILYRILEPLARAKVNLSKIESRPLKKRAWEYMFFVDLDGHMHNPRISKVLEKLKDKCSFFKILGSYPKGRISS